VTDLPGPPPAALAEPGDPPARVDLAAAAGWLALGAAIVVGSWRMDRLEELHINPYTAPGLVPGVLGLGIILAGLVLLIRSLRRLPAAAAAVRVDRAGWGRAGLSLILCLGFAVGLVGRGPPFWLAAAIFLFLHIFLFQYPERRGRRTGGVAVALACALGAAGVITFVFQELFLVRLP
jgi:hypothetical protein